MKITLLPDQQKFTYEFDGIEQEVLFSDVLDSNSWKEHKLVTVIHKAVDENGNHSVTSLNRDVYLENMKHGDEAYLKSCGIWDLNTTIHKLYALLDGRAEEEVETEIENVSLQRNNLDQLKRDWSNEQVEKYAALEQAIVDAETPAEKEKIEKKMLKIKQQKPPFLVSQEMKKMYYASRDESKPEVTLANVTPEAVKESYGDDLIIA